MPNNSIRRVGRGGFETGKLSLEGFSPIGDPRRTAGNNVRRSSETDGREIGPGAVTGGTGTGTRNGASGRRMDGRRSLLSRGGPGVPSAAVIYRAAASRKWRFPVATARSTLGNQSRTAATETVNRGRRGRRRRLQRPTRDTCAVPIINNKKKKPLHPPPYGELVQETIIIYDFRMNCPFSNVNTYRYGAEYSPFSFPIRRNRRITRPYAHE